LFTAQVWDPAPWLLFSLPEVELTSSGTGPVELAADITDGASNPFATSSSQWYVSPAGAVVTPDPGDLTQATLTCTTDGTYTVTFSGHGRSGEPGRRCRELDVGCTTGGGDEITVTLFGGVPLTLIYIPAGTFMMGSPADERMRYDREDLHEVTLTQGYYMGVTEVTQAQWEAVTGAPMPTSCGSWGVGPDYPAYCLSWDDIAGSGGFVDQLNAYLASTGQPGAGLYRLPTDAEWERAARAGNQYRFSHGDVLECNDNCGGCETHGEYMWWCGNDTNQSEPVGSKMANGFGLYDMHGNLWEWVQDWFTAHLGFNPQTNPAGPASGSYRVGRGGNWEYYARNCRSANRGRNPPSSRHVYSGFRLARSE
jgi:formylglycine-generating enzyme required for sulfatase activity